MSVSSEQYIGYTVNLKTDLKSDDFDFFDDFTTKYPVYDYYYDDKGKVLLIVDGMSGTYARLIFIEKCITDSWNDEEDYIVLNNSVVPEDVYKELNRAYKTMYDKDLDKNLIEYALWWHCH